MYREVLFEPVTIGEQGLFCFLHERLTQVFDDLVPLGLSCSRKFFNRLSQVGRRSIVEFRRSPRGHGC